MTCYEGKKPYIFAGYAHRDSARVMPILEALSKKGVRIWCDLGVGSGSDWADTIAAHLRDSAVYLAFISRQSVASTAWRQEFTCALNIESCVVPILLESDKLPAWLEMQLSASTYLHYDRYRSVDAFVKDLLSLSMIRDCMAFPSPATLDPLHDPSPLAATDESDAPSYTLPHIELLTKGEEVPDATLNELENTAQKIFEVLKPYCADAEIVSITQGPTVMRYELRLQKNVRLQKLTALADDLALALEVSAVRIEPLDAGVSVSTHTIEIPNSTITTVHLRDVIDSRAFQKADSKLAVGLGVDSSGAPVVIDLAKMPHLLLAGATGMGKSVCLHSIILSLLYRATPDEVKLLLIDPKKVEFNAYQKLPHLWVPVITSPQKAVAALANAVNAMEARYSLLAAAGVKNLKDYNAAAEHDPTKRKLPYIVIVVDELADLMLTARNDVEDSLCRLAQKARAAGIHLVLSTQRPSVDVLTGMLKANIPSRIALTVHSYMDSRTIIDTAGAEKLLGRGDMLYAPVSANRPIRVQGAFVLDDDIKAVTDFIRSQENGASYDDIPLDLDEKFADAVTIALDLGQISTAALQRKLLLGYGRAARILDAMETLGVVGPPEGSKPRRVIISKARAEALLAKLGQSRDTEFFDSDTEPLPVREKKPTPKPTNGTRRTTAEPAKKATAPTKTVTPTQEVYTPSGIAAYEGDEPYIFVSYAHKDADRVLPVLRELSERGFRLWFDENIETGGKWTMEIMRHVKNCAAFLAFVTPSYAESSFCEREATTAMNKNKVMIALYLERFTEPDWLEFCFTLAQNIDCTRYANTTAYLNKLTASGEILKCRNT